MQTLQTPKLKIRSVRKSKMEAAPIYNGNLLSHPF